MTSRAILVLGMHRSGTSAFARTLNLLGVHLSRNLLPAAQDNPTGYWESSDINALMERLLRLAGSRWHDWRRLDLSAVPAASLAEWKGMIRDTITRDSADGALFAIKEPRICRAVDLWLELFRSVDIEPSVLVPLRHPLRVAQSLAARNYMPVDKSLLLWTRHVLEVEHHTRLLRRVFVDYDDLLADWPTVMKRVASELELTWPIPIGEATFEVNKFLSPTLRHHHYRPDDSSSSSTVPWHERAWSHLKDYAQGSSVSHHKNFDELMVAFEQGAKPFERYFALVEDALEVRDARIQEIRTQLDRAKWMLGELTTKGSHAVQDKPE